MNSGAMRTGGILTFCNEVSKIKMLEDAHEEVILWQQQNR